ncbi:MAG: hypothetical protein MZU84_01430 [Sphingobacterium sp.]|nr:hypothetical protein [Sphingobacterium sp.]
MSLDSPVRILTLSQNSFDLTEKPVSAAVEQLQVALDSATLKTQLKEVQKQSGKILLTDAEIVVSGGRGMKSPDNWGPLVELAGAAWRCHSLLTARL